MKFEFMPRYTKYLCWYKTEIEKERSCGFLGIFSFVVFLVCLFLLRSCSEEPKPVYKAHYRPEELKMIEVFKKHGSDQPEAMAVAVHKTKKPFLLAAVAIKESNGRPKAVGDSGASKGAWQVQKYWGEVPKTATEQALQAEKILDELVGSSPRGSLLCALSKYNTGRVGTSVGKRYAEDVVRIMRRILKHENS